MEDRVLSMLTLVEQARVGGILGHDMMLVRLLEMGFVPGTPVKLVKVAPLGDPLQFEVRGYHILLRRAEAARVQIT